MTSPAPFILAGSIATRRHSLADRLAFALGLSAGAVGTSFVAQVGNAEAPRPPHMKMLPEHYELMKNGVAVFKLETGEDLSLTSDQYMIMDDGLLLITDELAQAWVYSLPVMGSVRAQLLSDLAPVATIDGTVAEATPQQTLAITQGTATRLSEQVDLQSYELAQASDGASSEVREAVALGLSVSPGAMALLGMLMPSDQPEGETEVEETPAPPAPPPEPEFWTDADVADSASTAITGSSGNSFVGYTAASTSAATDPLTKVGFGSSNSATFDMSAGGNNTTVAGTQAASFSGSIAYTGGSGSDSLTFGDHLASDRGSATFDMSLGGNNTFVAGSGAIAGLDASIVYTGGTGDDSLTFGGNSLEGIATFDMTAGGSNRLTAGRDAGSGGGTLTYSGGSGPDELRFGDNAALDGSFSLDLGGDSATDTVAFEGYVGVAGGDGGVQIQNFNVFDDLLTVARSFSVLTDSSPQGTITGIEMADQYGTINFNGLTGVSYTDFVAAITIS